MGSKGFIGTHCLNYFRHTNNSVYGCDVVTDYGERNYFLIDATNTDYREVFQNTQFDVCINCSGAASVPESLRNPRRDFELNALNVFKLLDSIRLYNKQCRIIHLSSAAVYGNPESLPIREQSLLNPISPYGFHKLFSEQICKEFVDLYGLNIAILRPFSVYGIGLKKQLFWDVYHKIDAGIPFKLHGSGEETRDFIHISDLMLIFELLIKRARFNGDIYNAANGSAVKIKDIVGVFSSITKSKVEYSFNNETKAGDPLYWQADIDKIVQLGYRQKVPYRDGLKEYAEWVKENR